ncbi:hypothetical protein AJ78_01914 [Emergomyces pasteurianus Ep9510]|uniref:Uncharacterized protein n=1 Tax=Emergomyces pasteurianus Ep9510 TaxID=1447872 RepID=A0A1J9PPD0_9EURO|nr:hypothetical protein AJ78_01914 [Emergomyces pasteurianus Ep9510]
MAWATFPSSQEAVGGPPNGCMPPPFSQTSTSAGFVLTKGGNDNLTFGPRWPSATYTGGGKIAVGNSTNALIARHRGATLLGQVQPPVQLFLPQQLIASQFVPQMTPAAGGPSPPAPAGPSRPKPAPPMPYPGPYAPSPNRTPTADPPAYADTGTVPDIPLPPPAYAATGMGIFSR